MLKAHNIQTGDTIFYTLLILCGVIMLFAILYLQQVNAVPYSWNLSPMTTIQTETLTHTNTELLLFDIDKNGIVDIIYNRNQPYANRTFGTVGVNNLLLYDIKGGLNIQNRLTNLQDNKALYLSASGNTGSECRVKASHYDVLTGNIIKNDTFHSGGNSIHSQEYGMITKNNNTAFWLRCQTLGLYYFATTETPNLNQTFAATVTAQATQNSIIWEVNTLKVYTSDHEFYDNSTDTLVSIDDPFIKYNPSSNTFDHINTNFDMDNEIHFADTVKIYRYGGLYPYKEVKDFTQTYHYERTIDYTTLLNKTMGMNLVLFDSDFTLDKPRFMLENSTGQYIGILNGLNIEIMPYDEVLTQLSNRAYANYRTDFAKTYQTVGIEDAIPTQTGLLRINPDLTTGGYTLFPQEIFTSGYGLKASSTLDRFYKTEWINDVDPITPIRTNTGTHTSLTLEIKNAFPDTSIRIRDPALYTPTSDPLIWLVDELQTDNTITFDLVTDQCVYVDIKNIGIASGNWVSLGFLCNNGLTYKILPNTSELNYQFWAFPLGANHIFNNTSDELQTQVRSNSVPFQYVVQLHDSNDNLVYDNIINSSTSVDLQTINATGFAKPIQLDILNYDNSNQTVYNANLGFPSYLSGIGLFINQYLVYEGFNLVFLMPLIFMAMFTRNTIGIGTVLTVVFIATMVWLGVISIPDYVIYAMMVIAAIGLIAYKVYY